MEIKKEEELFKAYEKIRKSGQFNMIIEWASVAVMMHCSRNEYCYVINNYTELKQKYGR